jgi:hypothetical protein
LFADPQSVTVNSVAISLPRIRNADASSSYRSADTLEMLTISSAEGKRNRRTVRLDFKKIGADPITAVNAMFTGSAYLVIDSPTTGFTNTELLNQTLGLVAYLTSANVTKVLNGES